MSLKVKNIATIGLFFLFSVQTHGAGKWREWIYRFLPFIAPKEKKLKTWEQRERRQLTKTVKSLNNLALVTLDLDLRNNFYGIDTTKKMAQLVRKEIHERISQDEQAEILEILAPSLKTRLGNILHNPKTAPHFFEIFQDAARGDLPVKYRDILGEFFLEKSEAIMALAPSPKQLKSAMSAAQPIDTAINILQEALDEGKNADGFLLAFDTVAWPSPSDDYKNALSRFFGNNAEKIQELPLPAKQIKHIDQYVFCSLTTLILLKGGLKHAKGDADKFFAAFEAIANPDSPDDAYRKKLNNFFEENAEAIKKLPLSDEQIKRIYKYIYYTSTVRILLEGRLKHAKGSADYFSTAFDAIASVYNDPVESYRKELSNFFVDNAEEIKKLPFSHNQVKRIRQYLRKIPTDIVLLQGGLKQAKGDANHFFGIFDAIKNRSTTKPNRPYRDALSKFFIENAEDIMNLGPSIEQIEDLNNYIDRSATSIKILELALERAEYAGDFFNVFHAVAPNSPEKKKKSQHIYRNFLTDHAEDIVSLGPSMNQMEEVSEYLPSPSALFDIAKERNRSRKTKKKKRKVCADNMAALLPGDAQ